MGILSFQDTVMQWQKFNKTVDGQAFISALWGYCKGMEVEKWGQLFTQQRQQELIAFMVSEEEGFIVDTKGKKQYGFSAIKAKLVPYFNDTKSQECAFVASMMVKFFDVLYPLGRNKDNKEIIGELGVQAESNIVCTSKWCDKLDDYEFYETECDDDNEMDLD